jgi:L-seryl-tRNA(Ser) seleniumtransferase
VNNCAAALFVALNTLAENGEVLISRGELIEIGDSFRIPDILRKSGAVLKEVGTTNKTRLSDYADAINEQTRLLLRVHPSNFRMVGFTSRPSLEALLQLCREKSIPLMEDLGSGCLMDLKQLGVDDEPNPKHSLAAGVSLVCFSGDKLLGGPQAGILAGHADIVQKIRHNPLFRALRVDKLTLTVLESVLISYLKGTEAEEIPLVRMIHETAEAIGRRAQAILEQVSIPLDGRLRIIDGQSMIGGGSAPERGIPSKLICISNAELSASKMEANLRAASTPILSRIEGEQLLLDLRTVFPEDDAQIVQELKRLLAGA